MKRIAMLIIGAVFCVNANAQMYVTLRLNHEFDGNAFALNQNFTDWQGNTVTISRAQYYLSGFEITHDGGQSSALPATYVLGAGNVTMYDLGAHAISVSSVEGIDFDLGVDSLTNHADPGQYAASHPLALQNPSTHWGWSSGYRFLMIEGQVDTDNDNVPDTQFEIHAVGDHYLTAVSVTTGGTINGSDITIDVNVNIADWLRNSDLSTVGASHGSGTHETNTINNTVPETVFTMSSPNSIDESNIENGSISIDCSMPYAPTINFQFPKATSTDLSITDINGRVVMTESGLRNEGRFFVNKELSSGTYLVSFTTNNGIVKSEKFIVRK
jgi:hypothetical protein